MTRRGPFQPLPFCDSVITTRLIFIRIQEWTQPGGLTPPGQTEPGIPYHVPSCEVPVGGTGASGTLAAGERAVAAVRERGSLVVQFVLCFLLICIIVVTVPFVCCSVKLPLS